MFQCLLILVTKSSVLDYTGKSGQHVSYFANIVHTSTFYWVKIILLYNFSILIIYIIPFLVNNFVLQTRSKSPKLNYFTALKTTYNTLSNNIVYVIPPGGIVVKGKTSVLHFISLKFHICNAQYSKCSFIKGNCPKLFRLV